MVIIVVVVVLIFVVFSSFASLSFIYRILKPYLKTAAGRSKVIKWALIFFVLGIVAYILATLAMRGPDYFEQGVNQLHDSSYINAKIGDFSSYSYYRDELKDNPKSPAKFRIIINGDSKKLFLTCVMVKLKDSWELTHIHQDSTIIQR